MIKRNLDVMNRVDMDNKACLGQLIMLGASSILFLCAGVAIYLVGLLR